MYESNYSGGGYAGLAAATLLCEQPNIEVELYEKEFSVGGQARSMYTDTCNVEYCWRIFGQCYHNIWYLFDKIGIKDNFSPLKKVCVLDKEISDGSPLAMPLLKQVLQNDEYHQYYKYVDFLFLCKDRAIHEYDNVNLMNYFNQNQMIKSLAGPYLGMEAKKLSISSFVNYIYSVQDTKTYSFSSPDAMVTNKPTSDAIFDPWEKWLTKKGVRIHKNKVLQRIDIEDTIKSVQINDETLVADEYIFACSLKPLNALLPSSCKTFKDMKVLEQNLQLYFGINLYFSEKMDMECDYMTINDGWIPIIQRKTLWKEDVMGKCHAVKNIQEVWNVGYLDFYKGTFNQKYVSECSIDEAIQEGIMQIKEHPICKKLFTKPFDEIFLGTEYWYQFKDQNGKVTVENPKFSINEGTSFLLPSSQPNDIPKNMYLAGYYTQSTQGGVSMESSTETGMNAVKKLLENHKILCDKPIKHTNNALPLHYFLYPFILLDIILYKCKLNPITHYVNSVYLLIAYIVFIIIILYTVIAKYGKYIHTMVSRI